MKRKLTAGAYAIIDQAAYEQARRKSHKQVAKELGITESYCRQLISQRARQIKIDIARLRDEKSSGD